MDRVFYIFRHGETDWNKAKKCQGHSDIPLNDLGLSQAKSLGAKVKELPLEIIYSSDLDRAALTGKTVAEMSSLEIKFDSRLREMSCGEAEGMLFDDAITTYGVDLWQRFTTFSEENEEIRFPGGETRKEVRERFVNKLHEILKETDYRHIGISTHGGALRNVLHSFLPKNHDLLPIPNCVLYKLTYNELTEEFLVDTTPVIS